MSLISALFSVLLTLNPDPLFSRMEGHWMGEGDRTYPISGRRIQVTAEVESRIENGVLVSSNLWTESESDFSEAPSRTYLKTYWIKPVEGMPGHYALGYGETAEPGAQGVLSENSFFFHQEIAPLVIDSTTEFHETHTLYSESLRNGETLLTRTVVRYTKTR